MTNLGIILILVFLFVIIVEPIITKFTNGKVDLIVEDNKKYFYLLPVIALVLIFNPFATNDSGYRTHVQTFSGVEFIRFSPGFYFAGFRSKLTVYPDVITIQYGSSDQIEKDVTFSAPPHQVKFNGGDNAIISHTVKWSLPDDEESMIGIHKDYRNARRLATTTLANYQSETAGYSSQMLDSESHYSGGQSQLKEHFQDQLRNGQILLDKRTQVLTDSATGKTATIIVVNPRRDSNNKIIRTPSDIQTYNITPSFVSIDKVDYSKLIEDKLKAKIESATIKSISEQKLITAQQQAETAVEEGKKQIEVVRAKKEAEKLTAVIEAQKEKDVARENALQAKYTADKIEEEGRAKAAANQALVSAGLTPQQQMDRDIKIADLVSKNVSTASSPQIVIMGGGQGSADEVMKVFGAERALELIKKIKAE